MKEKKKQVLTKEEIKKMNEIKEKFLRKNNGLVCRIDDGVEIWADQYQFILREKGVSGSSYFCSIPSILDELFERKAKWNMIESEEKNLLSVKKSIDDAYKWVREVVEPLLDADSMENHKRRDV